MLCLVKCKTLGVRLRGRSPTYDLQDFTPSRYTIGVKLKVSQARMDVSLYN